MTHRRGPKRCFHKGPGPPPSRSGAYPFVPPAPEEEKLRRLVVQLPHSTRRRFKQLAAEQGVTMSELCRAWVEEALAEHLG